VDRARARDAAPRRDLLGRARAAVGEDTNAGEDLGKGEVVLRDWSDDVVIASWPATA
jgi:hypothetical protein